MQPEAALQLLMKVLLGKRDDARGFGVGLGPHQRGAIGGGGIALQRQDREWPGGEEVFFGAAVMRALMRDRRDDLGLPLAPSHTDGSRLRAHARPRAIR